MSISILNDALMALAALSVFAYSTSSARLIRVSVGADKVAKS